MCLFLYHYYNYYLLSSCSKGCSLPLPLSCLFYLHCYISTYTCKKMKTHLTGINHLLMCVCKKTHDKLNCSSYRHRAFVSSNYSIILAGPSNQSVDRIYIVKRGDCLAKGPNLSNISMTRHAFLLKCIVVLSYIFIGILGFSTSQRSSSYNGFVSSKRSLSFKSSSTSSSPSSSRRRGSCISMRDASWTEGVLSTGPATISDSPSFIMPNQGLQGARGTNAGELALDISGKE